MCHRDKARLMVQEKALHSHIYFIRNLKSHSRLSDVRFLGTIGLIFIQKIPCTKEMHYIRPTNGNELLKYFKDLFK